MIVLGQVEEYVSGPGIGAWTGWKVGGAAVRMVELTAGGGPVCLTGAENAEAPDV